MGLNLSEWKYRNILEERGGPVKSLSYYRVANYPGEHCFAELRPELIPKLDKKSIIYRDGGGQGSSTKSVAQSSYKAISESLEAWAFYETYKSQYASMYGFDIAPSSMGMACYPGLTSRTARKNAMNEAIERWSVIAWWDGNIGIKKVKTIPFINNLTCEVYLLDGLWEGSHTVILQSISLEKCHYIYSFATSSTIDLAIQKAEEELCRNSRSIDRYTTVNNFTNEAQLLGSIESLKSLTEKRLIFFATQKGKELFDSKCRQKSKTQLKTPDLIINKEIVGPWSKYATVWRCLLRPTSPKFLENSTEYFMF